MVNLKHILVAGDSIVDKYIFGYINRQSPEEPTVPVIDVERREYRLGGCLNVAANIHSLCNTHCVSVSSVFSPFTSRLLENNGLTQHDSSCIAEYEHQSGVLEPSNNELIKTRIIDLKTDKQLIRVDNRLKYRQKDIDVYKETFEISDDYDAIVISDYDKGLVNGFTIEKLNKYKGLVFVDTKKPDLSIWKDIPNCIIKINNKEYMQCQNPDSVKRLIITQGKDGAYCKVPNGVMKYVSEPVENPDVIGCGDVFLAGLVSKYVDTQDLNKSIEFANEVAGKAAKIKGTAIVRL